RRPVKAVAQTGGIRSEAPRPHIGHQRPRLGGFLGVPVVAVGLVEVEVLDIGIDPAILVAVSVGAVIDPVALCSRTALLRLHRVGAAAARALAGFAPAPFVATAALG